MESVESAWRQTIAHSWSIRKFDKVVLGDYEI